MTECNQAACISRLTIPSSSPHASCFLYHQPRTDMYTLVFAYRVWRSSIVPIFPSSLPADVVSLYKLSV